MKSEEHQDISLFKLKRHVSFINNDQIRGNIVFDNVSFRYNKEKEKFAL